MSTTMPDFEVMAENLVIRYCCSIQPIEVGIARELKAMFEQGHSLGFREGQKHVLDFMTSQSKPWYEQQDKDEEWQAEFDVS